LPSSGRRRDQREIEVADEELLDLVAEGRAALAAPTIQRVHACLTVLPKLVDALDRVALYQHELRDIRAALTVKVRALREEVWKAQKMHPEVTYRSAQVHRAVQDISVELDRLDRLLYEVKHG
jgi:hypothetical protein